MDIFYHLSTSIVKYLCIVYIQGSGQLQRLRQHNLNVSTPLISLSVETNHKVFDSFLCIDPHSLGQPPVSGHLKARNVFKGHANIMKS